MITSVKTPNGYRVTIPDKLNTCHRKLEKEDSQENEIASLPCTIFSILKCEGSEACSYNIILTHTNSITKLKERKPHYQIVPFNETDSYKIAIEDESVSNVTIILNSNTGDADLFVTGLDNKFDSRSLNEGYIPDVIQIVKSQALPQIKGEYLVNVKGSTFASYSIYYYTHKEFENNDNNNKGDINGNKNFTDSSSGLNKTNVINLENGKIIKGFIIEEKGKVNYKVYSFNPQLLQDSKPLDIRITLTPEHSENNMFVVFDVNKIEFEIVQFSTQVKNLIWKSTNNNEIIISKSDPNYKKDAEYFIVIIPKYSNFLYQNFTNSNENTNTNNSTEANLQFRSFFFLGVTLENMPFAIHEGIPSSITLNSEYETQNYWYYHYNITNPVFISLNVFYGRVDIYVDFFYSDDITKSKTAIRALDTDTNFISISPEKLLNILSSSSSASSSNNNNNNNSTIPIFIMIKKSSFVNAQYLLAIKSHAAKPEKLQPSVVRKDILLSGEWRNYFMHLRRNETGLFNIIFNSGYGDLYMNIFSSDDYQNANNYPNSTNFILKAADYYRGKTLEISEELLARCDASCKVLLGVKGNNLGFGFSDDKIEFSLLFYKEALKINQNQPYHNQVNEGELQFFRVYFGGNTQNVYISLTNMNGDADIYVNYGTNLPTFEKADWFSYTARNEFIEFNKDDNFFTRNKLESLSGEYTIMISGFKKTSYSLYISSHPKKILPLNDDSPASCITKQDAQYCYFRYDDAYDYDTIINDSYNNYNNNLNIIANNNNNNNHNNGDNSNISYNVRKKDLDIVILTHFIYGSGEIFAKLYDDTDYDILADFPDEKNFDYKNSYSNKRNILHLNIKKDNPKYNMNSTILISVKCINQCFFDLTASRQYESTIKYLDDKKENIFYLYKSNSPLLFIYYNSKQGDLNYNLKALIGKAQITLFKNETNISNGAISNQNKIIFEEFHAHAESSKLADLHGLIKYAKLSLFENIYFKVTPEIDFAFSLRITYKNDWQEIKTGKTQTFAIDPVKKRFYGYFTMHSEYDNVQLSITANNKNLTAYCHVKYMAYDKAQLLNSTSENYMQNKIQTQIIPNELDYDVKGDNLNLYHLIALKLPKLDVKNFAASKIVTVFFSVALFDHSPLFDISDIKLNIRAAPQVNNITINAIPENSIEYVALEGFEDQSSIHIYDLKRKSETEDIMVLEVSSCLGAVEVLVSKSVINTRADAFSKGGALMPFSIESANGRNIYTFKNIDVENLYLVLNAKQVISQDCKLEFKENQLKCSKKNSEVLVKYFFTETSSIYNKPKIIDEGITLEYEILTSKSVSLKWKPLLQIDLNEQAYQANLNYEVYVSESVSDFLYMDSICFLNLFGTQKNKSGVSVEYSLEKNKAKITRIKPGKKYFVNILATNVDTKDIYAYKSIEILTQEDQFPPILIGIYYLLQYLFVYFYFY